MLLDVGAKESVNCPSGSHVDSAGQTFRITCPIGTTLGDRSTKVTPPGEDRRDGVFPCVACLAGTYKSTYGSNPCTSCLPNSWGFVGSTSASDREGIAGYTAVKAQTPAVVAHRDLLLSQLVRRSTL
ncbi:hypothetical protein GUITHDRAFT_110122 [Guillardia theta CCMP2712]|uniref:Tyrosine-protein kinase ephrin type A/B receptor-like domain-containing protein n=1 Tax=Guillardia theta (strain CCMP2712) TaxID=905079 RepID=L1J6Q7_GUITC|nr:hypothetical protein GUITHDRAFT_110122 [Guillardia theta CCMP2712]EKX44017.1 hypothetical protein GUITHDRAFT_110122 [Guillardia theta CCMP2712]|eukprot:XP_005830997.1 hypothetical protein GUITHDRAFT_110122 [Guillardia theta CCMP2712]